MNRMISWLNVLHNANMSRSINWRLIGNGGGKKVATATLPTKRLNQCTGRYRRNRVRVRTGFLPRGTIRSTTWKCGCWRSAASSRRINWCTSAPIDSAGNIPNTMNSNVSKRCSKESQSIKKKHQITVSRVAINFQKLYRTATKRGKKS